MSAEPYVVRRLGRAQVIPVIVFAGWLVVLEVTGFDFPDGILVAAAAYILISTALTLERLRIDERGVRVPPAGRIAWKDIDSVSCRGPNELAVRLEPGAPLPRGIRGAIDGELILRARGFELDPARVDGAVRAYSDAGGSFSGMPGSGASSSGRSAGGPSG